MSPVLRVAAVCSYAFGSQPYLQNQRVVRQTTMTVRQALLCACKQARVGGHLKWNPHDRVIRDRFHTLKEVQEELRRNGLESSQLIVGFDFTKVYTSLCLCLGILLKHLTTQFAPCPCVSQYTVMLSKRTSQLACCYVVLNFLACLCHCIGDKF